MIMLQMSPGVVLVVGVGPALGARPHLCPLPTSSMPCLAKRARVGTAHKLTFLEPGNSTVQLLWEIGSQPASKQTVYLQHTTACDSCVGCVALTLARTPLRRRPQWVLLMKIAF